MNAKKLIVNLNITKPKLKIVIDDIEEDVNISWISKQQKEFVKAYLADQEGIVMRGDSTIASDKNFTSEKNLEDKCKCRVE